MIKNHQVAEGAAPLSAPVQKVKSGNELVARVLFLLSAALSLTALGLIIGFLMMKGVPALGEIGLLNFLTGTLWMPTAGLFGVWPMIVCSMLTTLGALAIGGPIGVMGALYLTQLVKKTTAKWMFTMVDLLAGIPSVVYGFFGLNAIVPMLDKLSGGYGGNSLLAGIIILAMMILPTILSVSATSMQAVPKEYVEASLALGETETGSAVRVVLPAAKSGVVASLVLGMGRAVGETMALILVIGNTPRLPDFVGKGLSAVLQPVRTLTGNIAIEMGYATGLHEGALWAVAVVLLVFIVMVNMALHLIQRKAGDAR